MKKLSKTSRPAKYVYFFGGGRADGNESMKNLLGGKGANLAEMPVTLIFSYLYHLVLQ